MGMSTHIRGVIPDTDPEFQKHKKILLMCIENDVSMPKETQKYFNASSPMGYEGLIDEKLEVDLELNTHYVEYREDMTDGYEVDLTKLPKGVTKLRFTNSW